MTPPVAEALDPQRAPTQYVLTRWDEGAGLPSRSIHALAQTRNRYLWLGTSAGLVRFDGARFTVFDARRTPDFADGVVSSLSEAPDGTLYVGTTSAVMRYRQGRFESLPIHTGAGVVSSLLSSREGGLWIGLLGRPLHRWHNEQARPLTKELGTVTPEAMVEDGSGVVWIGTRDKGLLRFAGGVFDHEPGITDGVQALHVDRAETLWIGTPRGLLRRDGGGFTRFTTRDGLAHDNVSAILADRDGNLWVGTAGGGLSRLTGGRWSTLDAAQGLADDDVRGLLEDDEGNLWVATADGLNRLSDGRFTTYGSTEGLLEAAVSAVDGDKDGAVWLGLASRGVARVRGGQVKTYALPGGPGPKSILVIHAARDGNVWAARDDGRLFRITGDSVVDETPRGTTGSRVTAIDDDEAGPLFFLRGHGLVRLVDRKIVPVHAESSRLSYLYAMHRDRRGTLWLCGSMGLGRLQGSDFRLLKQKDGLPHDRVRSIVEDDGGLWLATIGGLARVTDGGIRSITTREGLPENHLRLVLDDGLGHLWLASAGHVFRVAKAELEELLAGRRPTVSPLIFGTADGLRSTETLLSSALGFKGADGALWFATARGVSAVQPARFAPEPAPRVVLEGFTVDGETQPSHEYRPGRGEINAELTTLTLRAPRQMRFRHRLDGFDDGWRDTGAAPRVHYGSLPAGRYRLLVQASNRDGVFGDEPPAAVAFAIRPPFHRTVFFYVLCAAALASLILAAHRLRVAQVHARFQAILGERTRIARELHDTLAQSLTGMGLQIEAALGTMPPDLSRPRGHLQRARSMVSASLAEVRRSIWVLRAQSDHGRSDLGRSLSSSLAQLAAHSGARLLFDVGGEPRPLPAEVERNLLRIAHEAVTNAVRHSGAEQIEVALRFEPDGVRLRVQDDGRGFDPETLSRESRGDHFGLVGMVERAQVMHGQLRVQSRPGAGTEIDCRLPYTAPPA